MTTFPESVHSRLRQAPHAVRRGLTHPRWLLANAMMFRRRRAEARGSFSLGWYHEYLTDEETAICDGLGFSHDAYERARRAFWAPNSAREAPGSRWNARDSLQSLVSVVVRLAQPSIMVETGVARGITSAVALAAMRDNDRGHLYSIDLPSLHFRPEDVVGREVPGELRDRWTLRLGPSRSVLPALLEKLQTLDVFLHDADHTYDSQMEEYLLAWPRLRAGGILLSDDVMTAAFTDFATQVGQRPFLIADSTESSAIGVMRRP